MIVHIILLLLLSCILIEHLLHGTILISLLYNSSSLHLRDALSNSLALLVISLIGGNLLYAAAYRLTNLIYSRKINKALTVVTYVNHLYVGFTDITIVYLVSLIPTNILQIIVSIFIFNIFTKIVILCEVHDAYLQEYFFISDQYHTTRSQIAEIMSSEIFNSTKYLIMRSSIELIDETFLLKDIMGLKYLLFVHDTVSNLNLSTLPLIYMFILFQVFWFLVQSYLNNKIINNFIKKACKVKSY